MPDAVDSQQLLTRLQRQVELYESWPFSKLLRRPWRLLYSALVAKRRSLSGSVVRTTATTFWGDRLNVALPELFSMALYRYGFVEDGLSGFFLTFVKPGMTVYDVGTHFGYFTLLGSKLVGPTGRVHSFEPTPSTYEVLRSNVAAKDNVTTNNVAMFSREADMEFQDFGTEFSEFNSLIAGKERMAEEYAQKLKPRTCTVHAITLDRYVQQTGKAPDFIKIDAENAEFDILQGAGQLLSGPNPPMISLEVGDVGKVSTGSTRPVAYLLDRGYRALEWDREHFRPRRHTLRDTYTYDNLLMLPPGQKSEFIQ